MPLERPGAEVGGAEPDQLAVGVDLVVVPRRVGLGRAEPLGEADEHHADRRRRRGRGSGERRRPAGRTTAGRSRCGRRSRRRAASRSKSCDGGDPEQHGDQRARARPARTSCSPSTSDERERAPTSEREPARVAEVAEQVPELLEEVALALRRRRSSFGSCPTMIVSASPTMKPLSTGSEMKLARKPSRSRPATSASAPTTSASVIVSATKSSVPPARDRRPPRPRAPRSPPSARRRGGASCRRRRRGSARPAPRRGRRRARRPAIDA